MWTWEIIISMLAVYLIGGVSWSANKAWREIIWKLSSDDFRKHYDYQHKLYVQMYSSDIMIGCQALLWIPTAVILLFGLTILRPLFSPLGRLINKLSYYAH